MTNLPFLKGRFSGPVCIRLKFVSPTRPASFPGSRRDPSKAMRMPTTFPMPCGWQRRRPVVLFSRIFNLWSLHRALQLLQTVEVATKKHSGHGPSHVSIHPPVNRLMPEIQPLSARGNNDGAISPNTDILTPRQRHCSTVAGIAQGGAECKNHRRTCLKSPGHCRNSIHVLLKSAEPVPFGARRQRRSLSRHGPLLRYPQVNR